MNATLSIRTNETTKKSAQLILNKLGMDLSTAVNIYLVKIVETRGIPFDVVTENGFTDEEEDQILSEVASIKKSKKSYSSAKAAHKAILGK
jgi:DNA-damage-inducible protein J